MSNDPYEVVAISKSGQYNLLSNGEVVCWDHMLDRQCDITDNMEDAVFAMHPLPNDNWCTVDLRKWGTVSLH